MTSVKKIMSRLVIVFCFAIFASAEKKDVPINFSELYYETEINGQQQEALLPREELNSIITEHLVAGFPAMSLNIREFLTESSDIQENSTKSSNIEGLSTISSDSDEYISISTETAARQGKFGSILGKGTLLEDVPDLDIQRVKDAEVGLTQQKYRGVLTQMGVMGKVLSKKLEESTTQFKKEISAAQSNISSAISGLRTKAKADGVDTMKCNKFESTLNKVKTDVIADRTECLNAQIRDGYQLIENVNSTCLWVIDRLDVIRGKIIHCGDNAHGMPIGNATAAIKIAVESTVIDINTSPFVTALLNRLFTWVDTIDEMIDSCSDETGIDTFIDLIQPSVDKTSSCINEAIDKKVRKQ